MANGAKGAVRILTVTISDLRKRHADDAGKKLDAELSRAGFSVVRHTIVADEPGFIAQLVRSVATNNEADAIVLSGGTGINPRDQTFEAVSELYQKTVDGFGEAFRRITFEAMGPRAMYFRVSAGIFDQCPVYSLPGNTEAALIGLRELIIPTLASAVEMATGRETRTVAPASGKGDGGSVRDLAEAAARHSEP
jgi:molybdopterin adenylyltransferase